MCIRSTTTGTFLYPSNSSLSAGAKWHLQLGAQAILTTTMRFAIRLSGFRSPRSGIGFLMVLSAGYLTPVCAQEVSSSIVGTVTDQTMTGIPAADVEVRNVATQT